MVRIKKFIKFIRYRFLLFAGFLPYLLGGAIASSETKFDGKLFLIGLIGLLFVLIGVEAFNEFFDYKFGTDRVFLLNPEPVSYKKFISGLIVFFIAFLIAVYLSLIVDEIIMLFAVVGFCFAVFYLAPPVKFAYRGLGELIIAISYGPLMTFSSYYIHTKKIHPSVFLISTIPAILLFAIAILNEIPDFFQDKLVGKKNICVRIGRKNTVKLYGAILFFFYIIFISSLIFKKLPYLCWLVLLYLPILLISFIKGMKTYNNPFHFIFTIQCSIFHYIIILSLLIIGYLFQSF